MIQSYVKSVAAPLFDLPDRSAKIADYIPQGRAIYAVHYSGDWYKVTYSGINGYMPLSHIAFLDRCSNWAERYGSGVTSITLHGASSSEQVTNLQQDLIDFFHPIEIDLDTNGIFDTKTEYIICHFQRIRLLPVSGIATPATKASLYAVRERSIAEKLLMEAL